MSRRYAVVVGCMYANDKRISQLYGPPLDITDVVQFLMSSFGFTLDNIKSLYDFAPDSLARVSTGSNIRRAINNMVNQCRPGDLLVVYFSGHGGMLKAANGRPEEEYIVPCDHNLITSREFQEWMHRLPPRASFVLVSDSCHSGGLIGQDMEQIGPSNTSVRSHHQRHKFLPLESTLQHLASQTNIQSNYVGDHLVNLFGNDVSPTFSRSAPRYVPRPIGTHNGILVSACLPHESAYESTSSSDSQDTQGVFTKALQEVLKQNNMNITHKDLVLRTREVVRRMGYSQHPCLYCSNNNVNKIFMR